jgi:hypothetical protein
VGVEVRRRVLGTLVPDKEGEGMEFTLDFQGTLTPAQAARKLGLSVERIRQMVRYGQLVPIRTPLGMLFKADDIDSVAKRRADKARQ